MYGTGTLLPFKCTGFSRSMKCVTCFVILFSRLYKKKICFVFKDSDRVCNCLTFSGVLEAIKRHLCDFYPDMWEIVVSWDRLFVTISHVECLHVSLWIYKPCKVAFKITRYTEGILRIANSKVPIYKFFTTL